METFLEFTTTNCISCKHCSLTKLTEGTTSFCYELYRKNWANFYSHIYPTLRKHSNWPFDVSREQALFEEAFCNSGSCGVKTGSRCRNFNWCLNTFTLQMMGLKSSLGRVSLDLSRKNDVPAVIFGGSKKWKALVNSMG